MPYNEPGAEQDRRDENESDGDRDSDNRSAFNSDQELEASDVQEESEEEE